jgi:hypothetical protein
LAEAVHRADAAAAGGLRAQQVAHAEVDAYIASRREHLTLRQRRVDWENCTGFRRLRGFCFVAIDADCYLVVSQTQSVAVAQRIAGAAAQRLIVLVD